MRVCVCVCVCFVICCCIHDAPDSACGKVRHCLITREPCGFRVGDEDFPDLAHLFDYYQRHPLFRATKLRNPLDRELLARLDTVRGNK